MINKSETLVEFKSAIPENGFDEIIVDECQDLYLSRIPNVSQVVCQP